MLKLTQIQKMIIQNLDLQDCSGTFLAELCGVSTKTIRRNISDLNYYLQDQGCQIDSHVAKGYQMVITDQQRYDNLIDFVSNDLRRNGHLDFDRKYDVYHLMRVFLSAADYLSVDALANNFCCSRSTMSKYIKLAKEMFAEYDIVIASRPNYGLYLRAKEWNRRLCMATMQRIYRRQVLFDTHEPEAFGRQFEILVPHTGQRLYDAAKEVLFSVTVDNERLSFPYLYIPRICYMIVLSYSRRQFANQLLFSDEAEQFVQQAMVYQVAGEVFRQLDKKMETVTGEQDILGLAALMGSYRSILDLPVVRQNRTDPYYDAVTDTLVELSQYYSRIAPQQELIRNLGRFLLGFRFRSYFNVPPSKEALSPLVHDSVLSAQISWDFCRRLEPKLGLRFSNEEILGTYSILNKAIIKELKNLLHCRLLVVSRYGNVYGQNIALRIYQHYYRYIDTVDVGDYFKLDYANLKQYDLIVTDMHKPMRDITGVEKVYVPFFHAGEDNRNLSCFFRRRWRETIAQVLPEDHFHRGVALSGKKAAFQYFYQLNQDSITDRAAFLRHLADKDDFIDANYGNGVVLLACQWPDLAAGVVDLVIPQGAMRWNGQYAAILLFANISHTAPQFNDVISLIGGQLIHMSPHRVEAMSRLPYDEFIERLLDLRRDLTVVSN